MIEVQKIKKTFKIVRSLEHLNVDPCAVDACEGWLKGRKVTGAVLAKLSFPDTHVVVVSCTGGDRIIVPADGDGKIKQWRSALQSERD